MILFISIVLIARNKKSYEEKIKVKNEKTLKGALTKNNLKQKKGKFKLVYTLQNSFI